MYAYGAPTFLPPYSLLPPSCCLDHRLQPRATIIVQLQIALVQQRGDGLLYAAIKKSPHQMSQGGPARAVARHSGRPNVTQPLQFMANVAFALQHAQRRAHGRITGRVRYARPDLRSGRAAALEQDVHDLPLPAAQLFLRVLRGIAFHRQDLILLGNLLRAIEDDYIERTSLLIQLQSKLILDGGEKAWSLGGVASRRGNRAQGIRGRRRRQPC